MFDGAKIRKNNESTKNFMLKNTNGEMSHDITPSN